MSITYRYTGSVPTVFIGLEKDGVTWTPQPGDEITVSSPHPHPYLDVVPQSTASDTTVSTSAVDAVAGDPPTTSSKTTSSKTA